jgi:hypothetical protein
MTMRKFNTKAMKLSTSQVRQMYDRLLEGETQGSLAREYGVSVVQVGRIARGESRAMETGAHEKPVPDRITLREVDYKASAEAALARLVKPEGVKIPPNPMFTKPEEEDYNPVVNRLLDQANELKRDDGQLDGFENTEQET